MTSFVATCSAQYRLKVLALAGHSRLSARFHFDGDSSTSRARFTICKSALVIGGLTLELSTAADWVALPCAMTAAGNRRMATIKQTPRFALNGFVLVTLI